MTPGKAKADPRQIGRSRTQNAMRTYNAHGPGSIRLCAEIKSRVTLRDVAAMLNVELPHRANVKFCSPFRPDRSPSCSIKDNVLRDWSTGESFDAIAFYARARGIDNAEAIRELSDKLGLSTGQRSARTAPRGVTPQKHPTSAQDEKPVAVEFPTREATDEDFAAIIKTRKLPEDAIFGFVLAHSLGVLQFGEVCGVPSWIVTDESRRSAEARRLDGQPFPAIGDLGARKAHTIKGSSKSWPVGLSLKVTEMVAGAVRKTQICLLEGGPDLLAAYAILAAMPLGKGDVLPAAMLGASMAINADALAQMAGRTVVIVAQGDDAGRDAASRWAKELTSSGCSVKIRELPEGKDLNNLVTEHGIDATKELITP